MIDMQRLYEMVWAFRRETAHVFPVPSRKDSLRFAVTEAGEALDAYLRNNGTYKRNRDKDHSERRELAQCLMMLFTAWGQRAFDVTDLDLAPPTLDWIVLCTSRALYTCRDGDITFAIYKIVQYVGPDIENELAQALDALRAKHGVKAVTEVTA